MSLSPEGRPRGPVWTRRDLARLLLLEARDHLGGNAALTAHHHGMFVPS